MKYIRLPLAAFAAALVLGSVWAYTMFAASVAPLKFEQTEHWAKGEYSLHITLTFDAVADAFSIEEQPPSLLVRFRGKELLRKNETVPAGTPIVISPIEGIVESRGGQGGRNEFYVEAHGREPAVENDPFSLDAAAPVRSVARALRVEIKRDGRTVADETLWSGPGEPVRGAVKLRVVAARTKKEP